MLSLPDRGLVRQLCIFLWTLFLIAMMFVTVRSYQFGGSPNLRDPSFTNLNGDQKTQFLAISIALTLLLGLSAADIFKTLAESAAPAILAAAHLPPSPQPDHHESKRINLIINLSEWASIMELFFQTLRQPRRPWIAGACVAWGALFIGTQTFNGLLFSVAVTVADGIDFADIYPTAPSDVFFPNLTCFFHTNANNGHDCPISHVNVAAKPEAWRLATPQLLAHNYGQDGYADITFNTRCVHYTDSSDILDQARGSDYIPAYYCRRSPGRQEFAYRFLEYNQEDKLDAYPFFTNRVITASSGSCAEYTEVEKHIVNSSFWNYTIRDDATGKISNLTIAEQNEVLRGTTYVYNGALTPLHGPPGNDQACGPRCMWVWAHRSPPARGYQQKDSKFFKCPITLSDVSNTDGRAELQVPDEMARLMAASIGLQGRQREPNGPWLQSQLYPFDSPWDIHGKQFNADVVGANMAEFAINSMAKVARVNPRITISGTLPNLGSHLVIMWALFSTLLIAVGVIHGALLLATVYVQRRWGDGVRDLSEEVPLRKWYHGRRSSNSLDAHINHRDSGDTEQEGFGESTREQAAA